MKQMKSCGASGFSSCDWNSFAICQLFQKKKKKDQHFDLNEYKMASIKSKTDYVGLYRAHGSLDGLGGPL